MDPRQTQFLLNEFFQLTLRATVQRARVYSDGLGENDRRLLRASLRMRLWQLWPTYAAPVPEPQHLANISQLADGLSQEYPHSLRGGRFRIGPAQKALNLFLKYLWCAGLLGVAPPHCPFDNVVIKHLHLDIRFTQLDNMAEYQQLVAAAQAAAHGVGLAQWELELYNQQYNQQ